MDTPHINEAVVLAKGNYFVDTHVWPLKDKLDPEGWLSNFQPQEREHALHLLNGFMYFSDALVKQLFAAAFRGLSRVVVPFDRPPRQRSEAWKRFLNTVVVTFPTGENPSVADSGHLFARHARDLLGIPEERILSPDAALTSVLKGRTDSVVFVDDIAGTGSQFIKTWKRRDHGSNGSYESSFPASARAYYTPLFATHSAMSPCTSALSLVGGVFPAHILTPEYSSLSNPSIFWPPSMAASGPAFIKDVSLRLGMRDTGGTYPDDWQGFNRLGLGIAFYHQIPDATLPIFYTTMNGWKPLWRRS